MVAPRMRTDGRTDARQIIARRRRGVAVMFRSAAAGNRLIEPQKPDTMANQWDRKTGG